MLRCAATRDLADQGLKPDLQQCQTYRRRRLRLARRCGWIAGRMVRTRSIKAWSGFGSGNVRARLCQLQPRYRLADRCRSRPAVAAAGQSIRTDGVEPHQTPDPVAGRGVAYATGDGLQAIAGVMGSCQKPTRNWKTLVAGDPERWLAGKPAERGRATLKPVWSIFLRNTCEARHLCRSTCRGS